jgi:hypothetical protein
VQEAELRAKQSRQKAWFNSLNSELDELNSARPHWSNYELHNEGIPDSEKPIAGTISFKEISNYSGYVYCEYICE